MNHTSKTQRVIDGIADLACEGHAIDWQPLCDHARTLERELAQLKAEIASGIMRLGCRPGTQTLAEAVAESNERLKAQLSSAEKKAALSGRLAEALLLTRKAYIPDGHHAPHDCFATGPLTGDPIQDLLVCPGCAAEAAYRASGCEGEKGNDSTTTGTNE